MSDADASKIQSDREAMGDAVRLHREGQVAQAQAAYMALLETPSVRFDALHMLGVLRAQQARPQEAQDCLRAALAIHPGHVAVLTNLGPVLSSLGQHEGALAIYDAVLAAQPDLHDAWNNRGNVLMRLGHLAQALESFDRSIACRPDFAVAIMNRGALLLDLGRPEDALHSLDRVIAAAPYHAEAHAYRGNALMQLGRVEDALASFDHALAGRTDYAIALTSRGNALAELGRVAEALASYDRALMTAAEHPDLLNGRGSVLRRLRRFDEALASFDRALAVRPLHAATLNNRGNVLRDLDRLDEAIAAHEAALAIDAGLAAAWTNLGAIHLELQRVDQAVACFDRVVALDPDDPNARLNRALAKLFNGDFAAAREDYDHRWRVKIAPPSNGLPNVPAWNGEDLRRRHIVIYEEQGLGDVIQFFRFLPLLLARGAEVSFLVRRPLHRLFAPYAASIHLLDAPPPGVRLDFQCALMSLPCVLGITTQNAPGDVPYLFAEPALTAKWRAAIGEAGLKIGLCWQGSPRQPIDTGRSIPLALFAPLAEIPDVRLISLQHAHGLDQLLDLPPGMTVEVLGPDFSGSSGFEDTAAVMACLDLVISCDTSVAHAAGALGRPVWVALKYAAEWRWQHTRTDCIWYPTARLYRQQVRHEWRPVVEAMAADLSRIPRGASR